MVKAAKGWHVPEGHRPTYGNFGCPRRVKSAAWLIRRGLPGSRCSGGFARTCCRKGCARRRGFATAMTVYVPGRRKPTIRAMPYPVPAKGSRRLPEWIPKIKNDGFRISFTVMATVASFGAVGIGRLWSGPVLLLAIATPMAPPPPTEPALQRPRR